MLASGRIADGKGMAAALLLGADGVNIGTRFMLTKESPIHADIKQVLLASDELQTSLIKRTLKRTGRYFTNAVAREIIALERPGGSKLRGLAAFAFRGAGQGRNGCGRYRRGPDLCESGHWTGG
ncbi:Nitronate monooxygenase [compost metagenome]